MPVTDEAIEKIKGMIVSGELTPGSRLPKEAELAERLGLSRSSLREAVRALSLIRVLDVRQGDGTYVTSLQPHLLLDAVGFVADFHQDDSVLEFMEVRRIVEPAATAMAATAMTDAEVDELRDLLDELDDDPSVEDMVANDLMFHRRIAAGSGNSVLCSFLDGVSGPTTRARIWRGLTEEGAVQRTLDQHRQIYQAIRDRQPDVARSWATVHIAGVEQWLRRMLATPGAALSAARPSAAPPAEEPGPTLSAGQRPGAASPGEEPGAALPADERGEGHTVGTRTVAGH